VKADASVYEGKRVIRRALALVPGLERVQPNVVTVAILIPAVLAGVGLWQGWWILAAIGAAGRMVLATLDGYVAERFERRTPLGAYLNRIVTEVADAIVLLGLLGQADALWVALAVGSAWIVNVAGVLGPVAGGSSGLAPRVRPTGSPSCSARRSWRSYGRSTGRSSAGCSSC